MPRLNGTVLLISCDFRTPWLKTRYVCSIHFSSGHQPHFWDTKGESKLKKCQKIDANSLHPSKNMGQVACV